MYNFFKKYACKNEIFYRHIIETIRNTLDINETKQKIVDMIGKTMKADRCFIAEYDKENDQFLNMTDEYLGSEDIVSYKGIDINKEYPNAIEIIKKGKNIIINNKELSESIDSENFYKEKEAIKKYKALSLFAIPLYHFDELLGVLSISFTREKHEVNDEEINMLNSIANQISLAIYHSRLFEKAQTKAQNEKTLREIMLSTVSTFDMQKIIKSIVTEAGKLFKADRCFYIEIDNETNTNLPLQDYAEYLSSEDIVSPTTRKAPTEEETGDFVQRTKQKLCEYSNDITKEELTESTKKLLIDYLSVKSYLNVPVFYGDILYGSMVLHYVHDFKQFTQEDIDMAVAIANQSAIVIHQGELYKGIQIQAEREALLRRISSTIRTSLNLEETFNIICSEIAKITNANRVAIVEMIEKYSKDIIRGEFKTNESFIGVKNIKFEREKVFEYLTTYVFGKNEPLIINNIEESDVSEFIKDFYRMLNVKSVNIFPIKKEEDEWGILGISYIDGAKSLNKFEISLIQTIIEQIYIAIKQAEMYDRTLVLARREASLRSIIEKIRSSLDIDETLTFICEETAKLFNVQRSSIVVFPDKKDYMNFELKKEYILSQNINGYAKISDISKVAEYWGQKLTSVDKLMAIDNIAESDAPDYFKNSYTAMGIKSIIGTVISDGNNNWGYLILSEYNQYREWSDEEKNLLKTISHQVYIAINQAELYEQGKIMLERERISRNIIEILRSSIDKTIIKKLFVKNIGKFFNAARVLLSEYDAVEKRYLPADENSEYLSSPQQQSLVGYDWTLPEVREFIQPLLEKRELNIYCWEEYIQDNSKGQDFINFFERYNIKSSYNFPIVYQQNIMGFFCIDFINESKKLSDEDINRARNMCTQAGVALYHATLYEKAQECFQSRKLFAPEVSEQIKKPTNEILDKSMLLCKNEFERTIQIEYLNTIIGACNQLLELTKDISDD